MPLYSNIINLIKDADTLMELKQFKNLLLDEEETVMLSNKTIHYSLKLVNEKIKHFDKEKAIQEILEMLF